MVLIVCITVECKCSIHFPEAISSPGPWNLTIINRNNSNATNNIGNSCVTLEREGDSFLKNIL